MVGGLKQVWSLAGDDRQKDVNEMFLQPFLAYQANKTLTLTVQSETIGDWEARDSDRWTVPVNLLVSKLWKAGLIPASFQLRVGDFVAHPDIGPSWPIRAAGILLLPEL